MYDVELRGGFDLLRMQRLTQRVWHHAARWHVGDLAWERRLHVGPSPEWPTRLWLEDDNEPLAWGWLALPDYLELVVDPSRTDVLAQEVIDWATGIVGGEAPLKTTVTAGEPELEEVFARNGFTRSSAHGQRYLACDPADVVVRDAPHGFRTRSVAPTAEDLEARAAVHIAAWSSATMTTDVYRHLQRSWPYRHELDIVAEVLSDEHATPAFASSCLAWYDDVNRVGELEPVGTDPRFRQRGLAAAVCTEAVRRLGEAGATRAIVYASNDPDYPAPLHLYRSIGFQDVTVAFDLVRNEVAPPR